MVDNSKNIKINKLECTSCGACVVACPVKCIHLQEDKFGCTYPYIDTNKCLNCGKCKLVCHLDKNNFNAKPSNNVYAAWSTNEQTRKNSASGGIASEIYNYCLENGIHCFGVSFDKEKGALYKEILNISDIEQCKNSKYVESRMGDVFSKIQQYLKSDERVVFIGLPCHVSALISFLGKRNRNLTTVDMLCHGTTPFKYLQEHIKYVENKTQHRLDKLSFRDPEYETIKYRMTYREDGKVFYNKGVYENDSYQCGYHGALTYRENCYNCHYARKERVGDLTISDFSGLGRIEKWNKKYESVSCLIVSESPNGIQLFKELIQKGRIVCEKRPTNEAYNYDAMFNSPSIPHRNRKKFLDEYSQNGNFEMAAYLALKKDFQKNRLRKLMIPIKKVKTVLRKIKRSVYRIKK